jgi:hypothetical protein
MALNVKEETTLDPSRPGTQIFPVAGRIEGSRYFESLGVYGGNIRAVATGEFRPPRRDEWFLSGAIITAYQALNDLSTPYYIAELVEIEVRVVKRIKRRLPTRAQT